MKYVYVAGPITKGDTLLNIRKGVQVGSELLRRGFAPLISHLDFYAYMLEPDAWEYEKVLQHDFNWLLRCDAMLRIPGESAGADREEAFCNENGIPVFHSLEDLLEARADGST